MYINDTFLLAVGRSACTPTPPTNKTTFPPELVGKFFCDSMEKDSIETQVLVASAFGLLMGVAIIGNAVVMWIIFKHKVMHHGFNYFLFNMALADLMIALFNVGTSWTFNLYYDWWYGELCKPTTFFGIAPTTVSVFSMMSLSWDRCQAVVNPLRKRPLSRRRSLHFIAVIWVISAATALPNAFFAEVKELLFYNAESDQIITRRICDADATRFPKEELDKLLFGMQYALPMFVLSSTFLRIACALRCSNVPVQTRVPGGSHQGPFANSKAKSKAIKMLALMVFAFMFCWLPYHLYHTFELSFWLPNMDDSKYVYIFIYWVAMSSTAYNPIIYCFANQRFRIGFRYVFRWIPFVRCKKQEYEYSQLFPEKLRSMAISLHAGKRIQDSSTGGFTFNSTPELLQYSQTKENKRKVANILEFGPPIYG